MKVSSQASLCVDPACWWHMDEVWGTVTINNYKDTDTMKATRDVWVKWFKKYDHMCSNNIEFIAD